MKKPRKNDATKDRKIKSCYIRKHINRKKVRKSGEASNCDSNEQSRKEQEEVGYTICMSPLIFNDEWIMRFKSTETKNEKAYEK